MKFKKELFQMNLTAILAIIGWNQTDFSRYLGVTKQSVSNWAKQKVEIPQVAYIAAMHVISTIGVRKIESFDRNAVGIKMDLLYTMTGYKDFYEPYWLYLE